MSSKTSATSFGADRDFHRVVWLTLALFLAYLCVAMSLPVTSLYVTIQLGFGNALAGLAVGVAFASTILTRGLAGRLADRRGGKTCLMWGFLVYSIAGIVGLAASWRGLPPSVAYGVLIIGRLLLGLGESMATVGVMGWTLGIMGPQRTGRVFALLGMGIYGAFAIGAPIGLSLFNWGGFVAAMSACALAPLIGLAMAVPVAAAALHSGKRPSFWRIIGKVWEPGLVLACQGVGFAAIGAFLPLFFLSRGWTNAGLGFTCFGGSYVLVRILFGHFPDRLGAVPVALMSMAVEATGQYFLWSASSPTAALVGACLTGMGCSLIYPAMGIEVVRRVAPHLRGTATGGFTAFQDLAYGLTGPATGLLADRFGYGVVFLIGGLTATVGFSLVIAIARKDPELVS